VIDEIDSGEEARPVWMQFRVIAMARYVLPHSSSSDEDDVALLGR
jgi:hypothetical protein